MGLTKQSICCSNTGTTGGSQQKETHKTRWESLQHLSWQRQSETKGMFIRFV